MSLTTPSLAVPLNAFFRGESSPDHAGDHRPSANLQVPHAIDTWRQRAQRPLRSAGRRSAEFSPISGDASEETGHESDATFATAVTRASRTSLTGPLRGQGAAAAALFLSQSIGNVAGPPVELVPLSRRASPGSTAPQASPAASSPELPATAPASPIEEPPIRERTFWEKTDISKLFLRTNDREFAHMWRGTQASGGDLEAADRAISPGAQLLHNTRLHRERLSYAEEVNGMPKLIKRVLDGKLASAEAVGQDLQTSRSWPTRIGVNTFLAATTGLPIDIARRLGAKKWLTEVTNMTSRAQLTFGLAAKSVVGTNRAISWHTYNRMMVLAMLEAGPYGAPAYSRPQRKLESNYLFNIGIVLGVSAAAVAIYHAQRVDWAMNRLLGLLPSKQRARLHKTAETVVRFTTPWNWNGFGKTALKRTWAELPESTRNDLRPGLRQLRDDALHNAMAVDLVRKAGSDPNEFRQAMRQLDAPSEERVNALENAVYSACASIGRTVRANPELNAKGTSQFFTTQLEMQGESWLDIARTAGELVGMSTQQVAALERNPRRAAKLVLVVIGALLAGAVSLMNYPNRPSMFGNAAEGISTCLVLLAAALSGLVSTRSMVENFCMMFGGSAVAFNVLGADWIVNFARGNGLKGEGFIDVDGSDVGVGLTCLVSSFINLGLVGPAADAAMVKLEPAAQRLDDFVAGLHRRPTQAERAITRAGVDAIEQAIASRPATPATTSPV